MEVICLSETSVYIFRRYISDKTIILLITSNMIVCGVYLRLISRLDRRPYYEHQYVRYDWKAHWEIHHR
jgi:hypothetical protein